MPSWKQFWMLRKAAVGNFKAKLIKVGLFCLIDLAQVSTEYGCTLGDLTKWSWMLIDSHTNWAWRIRGFYYLSSLKSLGHAPYAEDLAIWAVTRNHWVMALYFGLQNSIQELHNLGDVGVTWRRLKVLQWTIDNATEVAVTRLCHKCIINLGFFDCPQNTMHVPLTSAAGDCRLSLKTSEQTH